MEAYFFTAGTRSAKLPTKASGSLKPISRHKATLPHPIIQCSVATGIAVPHTVLAAYIGSSYSKTTGKITHVGPTAISRIVDLHNVWSHNKITDASCAHLTGSMWSDRLPLQDTKRRRATKIESLVGNTCIRCAKYVHKPARYAATKRNTYVLCEPCATSYSTLDHKRLVPLVMAKSCFSGNRMITDMLDRLGNLTRFDIVGLLSTKTNKGVSIVLQPIGNLGFPGGESKRRVTASITFWTCLAPDNDTRAVEWLAIAQRTTKKNNKHNQLIQSIVAKTSQLTSRGRARFSKNETQRLVGANMQGEVFVAIKGAKHPGGVDTRKTDYISFRVDGLEGVFLVATACAAVLKAIVQQKVAVEVHLAPRAAGSAALPSRFEDTPCVDCRTTPGFEADVVDGAIVFTNTEHLTWEHIWRAIATLGATSIVVVGSVRKAIEAASVAAALNSWKAGHTFWELATALGGHVTVVNTFLSWDLHPPQLMDKIREENTDYTIFVDNLPAEDIIQATKEIEFR